MNSFFKVLVFYILLNSTFVWASVDFDGIDDGLNCGSAASVHITGDQTLCAWANRDRDWETTFCITIRCTLYSLSLMLVKSTVNELVNV